MTIHTAHFYFSNFSDTNQLESFMNEFIPQHWGYQYAEEIDKDGNREFLVVATASFNPTLSEQDAKNLMDKIQQAAVKQNVKFNRGSFFY